MYWCSGITAAIDFSSLVLERDGIHRNFSSNVHWEEEPRRLVLWHPCIAVRELVAAPEKLVIFAS